MASINSAWHSSESLLRAVQGFHERHARQPKEQIDEARTLHTVIMGEVERRLRERNICVRMEYTGSTYEGTKVAKSSGNYDLEFDVMVIIDCRRNSLQIERLPQRPGFARLEVLPSGAGASSFFGHVEGNYLNAQKTANKFFGELQKCINVSDFLKGQVQLTYHGPAAQMDVSRIQSNGTKAFFYSVDVVPAYEINGERYVAKPVRDETMPDMLSWRRSFSLEEKDKLVGADRDNGCRKKVLRILKVIRNGETGLAQVTSYHLKTALFWEMNASGSDWKEEKLGQRLMGVLGQLERFFKSENFPHYYLKTDVNLISSMSSDTISNIRGRISRFRSSEIEMMRILST